MVTEGIGLRELQRQVAAKLPREKGTSYGTIRAYVGGEVYRPRRIILKAIADVLGVRAEWLVDEAGYPTDREQQIADELRREREFRERVIKDQLRPDDVVWLNDDVGLRKDVFAELSLVPLAGESLPVSSLYWEILLRASHIHQQFPTVTERIDFANVLSQWTEDLFGLFPYPIKQLSDHDRADILMSVLSGVARLCAVAETDMYQAVNDELKRIGEPGLDERTLEEVKQAIEAFKSKSSDPEPSETAAEDDPRGT